MFPADPAPTVYLTISMDYWQTRSHTLGWSVSGSPLQPTVRDLFYLGPEDAVAAGGGALPW